MPVSTVHIQPRTASVSLTCRPKELKIAKNEMKSEANVASDFISFGEYGRLNWFLSVRKHGLIEQKRSFLV